MGSPRAIYGHAGICQGVSAGESWFSGTTQNPYSVSSTLTGGTTAHQRKQPKIWIMVWSAGCGLGRACSRPYCCALEVPRARSRRELLASGWSRAGVEPVTGKRVYLRETIKGTNDAARERAEKVLTKLLNQVNEQNSAPSTAALSYALSEWLRASELEESTRHTYEGYLRRTRGLPPAHHPPRARRDSGQQDQCADAGELLQRTAAAPAATARRRSRSTPATASTNAPSPAARRTWRIRVARRRGEC